MDCCLTTMHVHAHMYYIRCTGIYQRKCGTPKTGGHRRHHNRSGPAAVLDLQASGLLERIREPREKHLEERIREPRASVGPPKQVVADVITTAPGQVLFRAYEASGLLVRPIAKEFYLSTLVESNFSGWKVESGKRVENNFSTRQTLRTPPVPLVLALITIIILVIIVIIIIITIIVIIIIIVIIVIIISSSSTPPPGLVPFSFGTPHPRGPDSELLVCIYIYIYILYYIMLYYVIVYSNIFIHTILYNIIFYYILLYYIITYYIIVYYIIVIV